MHITWNIHCKGINISFPHYYYYCYYYPSLYSACFQVTTDLFSIDVDRFVFLRISYKFAYVICTLWSEVCLLLLSIIISRFIYIVGCITSSFLLIVFHCIHVLNLFILVICWWTFVLNKATMKSCVQRLYIFAFIFLC